MIYEYSCPRCGLHEDRSCYVDERDSQMCSCGAPLERVFTPTVRLLVPPGFGCGKSSDRAYPQTKQERKKWDDDGVRPTVKGRWI